MTNDKALDAFLEKRNEFDKLIARLAALSEDHFFGAEPEEINWGHVGTLTEWTALLRRVADAAFGEGEHTEPQAAIAQLGALMERHNMNEGRPCWGVQKGAH